MSGTDDPSGEQWVVVEVPAADRGDLHTAPMFELSDANDSRHDPAAERTMAANLTWFLHRRRG